MPLSYYLTLTRSHGGRPALRSTYSTHPPSEPLLPCPPSTKARHPCLLQSLIYSTPSLLLHTLLLYLVSNNARPSIHTEESSLLNFCSRQISASKETRSAQAKRRRQSKVGLLYLQNSQKGMCRRRPVQRRARDSHSGKSPMTQHPPEPPLAFCGVNRSLTLNSTEMRREAQ